MTGGDDDPDADPEHTGHCVLCTPASHPNRDEHTQVTMELDAADADPVGGGTLAAAVRVCEQHYRVIERAVEIDNDCYQHTTPHRRPTDNDSQHRRSR